MTQISQVKNLKFPLKANSGIENWYVFDLETDNLYDKVTKIHCLVLYDVQRKQTFTYGPNDIASGLEYLARANVLIGHNIMNDTKTCNTCIQEKPLSCFYARADHKSYRHECKDCTRIKQAERWAKNPEFKKRGVARQRRWQRQKLYNLSLEQEQKLLKIQKNACAICNKVFKTDADYHVDHCHNTNKVRGLLCPLCNKALGLFKDNPKALREAANYVESQGIKVSDDT